ncbi:MAG TPA: Crp/Fnr family transcriptional regulator [Casimicrobiaceae bacterium]|nr:Crp/Fnr family transcriptional regulator [Casimicrobiaceae bacterium]
MSRGTARSARSAGSRLAPALDTSARDWLPKPLRDRSRLRELAVNDVLFRQGDGAYAIFEIERGRLRLVRHTIDSHRVVLHTARAGELFAEAALFSATYHCDAVAAAASRVRVYPKRDLLAAFRSDPETAQRFMALLARQVHALRAQLEERNIRSARERVLHHIVLRAGADGRTMRLEGTLMDLAAEIGLTPEALYRTLAGLENDGTILRTRDAIARRKS